MLTEQQLELRKTGIGSSEMGAIVGASPFATPVDVFMRKLELTPPAPNNAALEAGNFLEDAVASWAATRHGWRLERCNRTLRSKRHEWMLATPDRFVLGGKRSRKREAMAEIKTTRSPSFIDGWGSFGADGTDEIPDCYRVQVQHQMTVVGGIERTFVPVFFFDSRQLRTYVIDHSQDLEDALVEAGRRFWVDNVMAKEVPELDPRASATASYLAAVLPQTADKVRQAPPEAAAWAEQLADANERKKAAEADKEEAENYLKAHVGTDRGIESHWGRFLWSTCAGRPAWKQAFDELAGSALVGSVSETDIKAIIERNQTAAGRQVRFTPRKK